mgnify:CR=1 FL=1
MYEPEVGDYVIWEGKNYDEHDEGWVYFKCPEMLENVKEGLQRYITIETGIRPRPICETEEKLNPKMRSPRHKYIHTLLLCYQQDWSQLKYIHSRPNCKSKIYYNRFQINDAI